jgi:hypothetical protein
VHDWNVLNILDLVKDISLAFEMKTVSLGVAGVSENGSNLLHLVGGELMVEQKLAIPLGFFFSFPTVYLNAG